MRDKRSVNDLTIEELERILAIRKREARQERLRRFQTQGRRLADIPEVEEPSVPGIEPQQHEAAHNLSPIEPPVTYDITDDVPRFEDDLEPKPARRVQAVRQPASMTGPQPTRRHAAWDKLLLLVEIAGVVGILAVLVGGGYLIMAENDKIDELEEKSAQIQRDAAALRPTSTPAPELRVQLADYVLPGGHTFNGGLGQFNLDELPESIRPVAVLQINQAAPRAEMVSRTPNSPITVEIPAIGVNASIWEGDDWFTLQQGVGHYPFSANPGEDANMVLTAHNDIYGEIFRYLEDLKPGDEIHVEADNGHWYTYVVENTQIVDPTDVWVLEPGNEPLVTLISCWPYRVDNKRIVVIGRFTGQRDGA